jgi:hypothetical protein
MPTKANFYPIQQKSTHFITFHHRWVGQAIRLPNRRSEATHGVKIQNQSQFPPHSTKFITFHHYRASATVASLRPSAKIQNQTQFPPAPARPNPQHDSPRPQAMKSTPTK